MSRRRELIGAAAAVSVRVEEVLVGRTRSDCEDASAARLAACLLRCGSDSGDSASNVGGVV